MSFRHWDTRVSALVGVSVMAIVVVIIAVVLSVRGVLDVWINPPTVSKEEQAAIEASDAASAEARATLEKKLSAEDAWALALAYGKSAYPEGFSFNAAGTIWETAADENTWDLRATCRATIDGSTGDYVCRAVVVLGSSGEPYVKSFMLENG